MQDGFSETFHLRPGEERLNGGQWRPCGTLAQTVFRLSWAALYVESLEELLEQFEEVLSPGADLQRLRRAARFEGLRPNRAAGRGATLPARFDKTLRQLRRTRTIVELLLLNVDSFRRTWKEYHAFLQVTYATTREMVRWEGPEKDEDTFRVSPVGAVLVSAFYGVFRGRLRCCSSCGSLTVFPRTGFERRYCDRCRNLRFAPRQPERGTGLPVSKAERWRRVLGRMRRRGFPRLGYQTEEKKRRWKGVALAALHECKTERELDSWEQRVAPMGRPGRPRKSQRTGQSGGVEENRASVRA